MVLVFDFGLGQRRAVLDAPVHRLEALIHVAAVQKLDERARDHRVVVRAHGQVRIVPLAQHAEALEILALDLDELLGVLAAGAPDVQRGHLGFARAQIAIHLDFNGEPMAIPPRHIGGVETRHGLGLDDEVLQNLVESGAQVDPAVGVGRPVVQDVGGAAGARGANGLVELLLFPAREHLRLGLREIGLHGESRFRQIDGLLEVQVVRFHYRG